jgi:hypothetical protein
VEAGVARVDAVLIVLKTEDMVEDVLVLPVGLIGVCERGRFK